MSEIITFTFTWLTTLINIFLNYEIYRLYFMIPITIILVSVIKKIME